MRSSNVLNCVVTVLALAATGCTEPTAPPPESTAVATGAAAPQYVIGPGDALDVFVYLAPELSTTNLPVRPDGRISLPLVPDIVAAGRSPSQLAADVTARLRQYVNDPNVTVLVRSFVGSPTQQVRIIGEATQPRTLPYREGMTVVDAIIEARGLTRYAAGNRAEIIRRDAPGAPPRRLRIRLDDLMRGGDTGQDVPLRPGDTIVIPQGWF
ncbi:MAG TPA: XrtA/PEP-CTERM system exopolysaccharide export protein [Vineibacter sp.]|nr:XrtA/PEP-CTERM system exopolysaccharide export protein [Vineibacter sp.]